MQALPGELFICLTAVFMVPRYAEAVGGVGATVEFAVEILKVRHIVLCGHSDCGAMKALMTPEKVKGLRAVSAWIRHADRVSAVANELHGNLDDRRFLNHLIEENVIAQLDHLITYPCVAAKLRSGNLFVHGMIFDIPKGEFRLLDRSTLKFLPLTEVLAKRAEQQTLSV
jgi:carbonic anhydrase